MKIGLIKEGKIPRDNRVPFTPVQCRQIKDNKGWDVVVQSSDIRCFSDQEYIDMGIEVTDDLHDCDVLFGVKEVPPQQLIPNKKYFFFSHTKKQQPYNQDLFRTILKKKITLVDYENLEHVDGRRVLGFGYFAGVVGAHNGILAYGNRTGDFALKRIYKTYNYETLRSSYFELKLPAMRVVFTGNGRVAHGILEILNLMGMQEVEPEEYLKKKYTYPVYTNLTGPSLYRNKKTKNYSRDAFHHAPEDFKCLFEYYTDRTDVLINGMYWANNAPRLFEMEDMKKKDFVLQTISDITDDKHGSVPCNYGDISIEEMVYGVDKMTGEKTKPYQAGSVDVLSVGNLPNELPRDASRYFGEQLIKYVMDDLLSGSEIIEDATMTENGHIRPKYAYLGPYAGVE